ncbi:MAG: ATP-grasp domain-containing protein [Candidatus Hermodarchaeota archaeon]
MKIALVLNTRKEDSEFEVEYDPPHTIKLIKHGIEQTGHEYEFIEADENVVANLKKIKPDLVFNRAEGIRGESRESHIPAILEMLNIPYVGSNVLTTAIGLNKTWAKKCLMFHEILTPKFFTISDIREIRTLDLSFPLILKPNEEGSSMGINEDNISFNIEDLKLKLQEMISTYQQSILVEQFIEGREFSVGLLGRPGKSPEMLSILEIDFSKFPKELGSVFGQRAKTIMDSLDHYICPAKILKGLKKRLQEISLNIWRYLDIKDFARIDFRMNKRNQIYFLEINPLPGMDFDPDNNDFSFYPYMAMKSGYNYDQLIYRILESACYRYNLPF